MNQTGTTVGVPSPRTVAIRARWFLSARKSSVSTCESLGIPHSRARRADSQMGAQNPYSSLNSGVRQFRPADQPDSRRVAPGCGYLVMILTTVFEGTAGHSKDLQFESLPVRSGEVR